MPQVSEGVVSVACVRAMLNLCVVVVVLVLVMVRVPRASPFIGSRKRTGVTMDKGGSWIACGPGLLGLCSGMAVAPPAPSADP